MFARLKLNFSEKVFLCSRDTAATYKLLEVFLNYKVVAIIIGELHSGTTLIPYTKVISVGVVIITTAQLHSIKLNSGSAQVQILNLVCQRFEMVRISDNVRAGNKAKVLSSVNHTTEKIHQFNSIHY